MSEHRERLFTWTLVLLLPIFFVTTVLANPVEEYAEDAAYMHIYRGVVFSEAVDDGWLYPRWTARLNGGLGSPLFSFYPPALYYALDLIHRVGLSHAVAWRIVVAFSVLVAMAGAFALGLALWGRADAALVGATAYAYAPYLQQDLLQRGSPEGLAIALCPWVLLGLLRLAERPTGARLALASLAWALLILTHSLMARLLAPVAILFALYLAARHGRRALPLTLASLSLGALLAAFYVLPFISEISYIHFNRVTEPAWAQPAGQPLMLDEFLTLPPVFDVGLDNNAMLNHRVSVLQALALALGLVSLPLLWRRQRTHDLLLVGGAVAWAALLLWLQTEPATWVWRLARLLQVLQFRWRLLGLVGLFVSVVLGALVTLSPARGRRLLVGLACVALVAIQLPSLYPQLLPRFSRLNRAATAEQMPQIALEQGTPDLTATSEFVPRWREGGFSAEETQWAGLTPIANLPLGARLIQDERRTGWIEARYESPVPFAAAMHLLYYPGWVGYVDGVRQLPRPAPSSGYAVVDVPAGTHTIALRYEGTLTQHLGGWLSLATAALLVIAALFPYAVRVSGSSGWSRLGRFMGPFRPNLLNPLHPLTPNGGRGSTWPSPRPSPEYGRGNAQPSPRPSPEYGRGSVQTVYLAPAWGLPALLVLAAALKVGWIDPHTTLFRHRSTPQAVAGARAQAEVHFGEELRLCGYTLPRTTFRPGEMIEITLYWLCEQPMDDPRAHSFVHLLGTTLNPKEGHYLWGQLDRSEQPGRWETGKLRRDVCRFRILPDAPPGPYKLEIGWIRLSDDQLLPPTIVMPDARLAASEAGFLLLSGLEIR